MSGPMRFFLTAPLFAIAAGMLLLWFGNAALATRWAMPTLALTHLITLGFLGMAMCGALLQILPVVAGVPVSWPALTARLVHVLLSAGVLLLAAGFLDARPLYFRLAAPLLATALFWLLLATGAGMLGRFEGGAAATASAIRLARMALAVTACLGIALAGAFGWPLRIPMMELTDLHAAWGLLGWVGLLVAGVAFQVIPMFQGTSPYPERMAKHLPLLVLLLLTGWTLTSLAGTEFSMLRPALGLLLAASLASFGAATLHLLLRRRRAPDPMTLFWRLSVSSLLCCAALYALPWDNAARALLLGMLFIVGFAGSAVNGMLYKIVPFLLWYELQHRAGIDRKSMPNIRTLLPETAARKQFRLHLASLMLMLAAIPMPALARPAGALFAASSLVLWLNLLRATRLYRRASSPGTPTLATQPS